jgi:hypothetical protein
MLQRVRMANRRRVMARRPQVRRMYPLADRGFAAERASGMNRRARPPRALAQRMKAGIRRIGQVVVRVARDGLAQYLRVRPLEKLRDRK